MYDACDNESIEVKCGDLLGGLQRGKESGSQNINGIPDAMVRNDSIDYRENRHHDTSRKAAFYSGGNWIDFERQARPVRFMGNQIHSRHFGARRNDGYHFG